MTAESFAIRRSSRLVIVSAKGRLLLFRYHDEHSEPFWATVGGELIGDETYEQAAIRELHEETGYNAKIGKRIRDRDAVYAVARSEPARWMEQYFLVKVASEEVPSRESWTAEENATIIDYRWWSTADLSEGSVALKPDWIPELLDTALSVAGLEVG